MRNTARIWLAGMLVFSGGVQADSLPSRLAPPPGAPSVGAPEAPVVVVEFIDYRCPYCARQAREALPVVHERFVRTGRVRHLFIEALSPGDARAERDAVAARCAAEQGRFEAARDYLLGRDATALDRPLDMQDIIRDAGLEPAPFVLCVESGRPLGDVREAVALALRFRVSGTPTYFLGYPVAGADAVTIERHLVGAVGAEPILAAIEDLLKARSDEAARRRVDR